MIEMSPSLSLNYDWGRGERFPSSSKGKASVVRVGSQGGNVEGKHPSDSDDSQTVIEDDSKVWA